MIEKNERDNDQRPKNENDTPKRALVQVKGSKRGVAAEKPKVPAREPNKNPRFRVLNLQS